jgi:hypothetical protein
VSAASGPGRGETNFHSAALFLLFALMHGIHSKSTPRDRKWQYLRIGNCDKLRSTLKGSRQPSSLRQSHTHSFSAKPARCPQYILSLFSCLVFRVFLCHRLLRHLMIFLRFIAAQEGILELLQLNCVLQSFRTITI